MIKVNLDIPDQYTLFSDDLQVAAWQGESVLLFWICCFYKMMQMLLASCFSLPVYEKGGFTLNVAWCMMFTALNRKEME